MADTHRKRQTRGKRVPGKGFPVRSSDLRQISCYFDNETFEQIRTLAVETGVSLAEQARQLVEFGLQDVEDKA